jgi:hypothetical protein
MATPDPGLFSFKRQQVLDYHQASLFGGKFDVWVLERWKFTSVNALKFLHPRSASGPLGPEWLTRVYCRTMR